MDINEFKDKQAAGTLTRREVSKAMSAVGLATVAFPAAARQASAQSDGQALSFTWAGYDIPELYQSYEEENGAPHALYGHVANHESYSVGNWLRDIGPILSGDKRPIIVGGTGLYFRALTEGLADIPTIPADIRAQSAEILSRGGLQRMLEDLDAETRAKIDVQNPMRVARAWEVLQGTGQSIVSWQAKTPPPLLPLAACHALHLTSTVDWLNDRLKRRFDIMIAQGALTTGIYYFKKKFAPDYDVPIEWI